MTVFELQTSGVGSNRSTNWATTTALLHNTLPLGPVQPSSPSTKELHDLKWGLNSGAAFKCSSGLIWLNLGRQFDFQEDLDF